MANLVNDIKPFCLETMKAKLPYNFFKSSNKWKLHKVFTMSGYKWNGKKWVSVKLT